MGNPIHQTISGTSEVWNPKKVVYVVPWWVNVSLGGVSVKDRLFDEGCHTKKVFVIDVIGCIVFVYVYVYYFIIIASIFFETLKRHSLSVFKAMVLLRSRGALESQTPKTSSFLTDRMVRIPSTRLAMLQNCPRLGGGFRYFLLSP